MVARLFFASSQPISTPGFSLLDWGSILPVSPHSSELMANHEHTRLEFVGALRGIACLLVVYAHIIAAHSIRNGIDLPLVSWVSSYVTEPFGIIQNFGWFGVVLFFLISGYIITHTTRDESHLSFFIKRSFRIYPAYAIAVLVTALIWHYQDGTAFHNASDYLLALSLSGIWPDQRIGTLGVEWTLIIEIRFYVLTLLLLSVYKRWPALGALTQLSVAWWCIAHARDWDNTFFLFTVGMTYIPFLICGQLLYLFQYRRIAGPTFCALTFLALYVAILGVQTMHPRFLRPDNSYFVTFAYCYAIFAFCMLRAEQIRSNAVTRYFENISYSLYIYHGAVAGLVLFLLPVEDMPPLVSYSAAIAAACIVSSLSYRYVERPSQRLSRRIVMWIESRAGSRSGEGPARAIS